MNEINMCNETTGDSLRCKCRKTVKMFERKNMASFPQEF